MKKPIEPQRALNAIFVSAFSRLPHEDDFAQGHQQFVDDFLVLLKDAVPNHIQEQVIDSIIGILSSAGCDPDSQMLGDGDFGNQAKIGFLLLCQKIKEAGIPARDVQEPLTFPEPAGRAVEKLTAPVGG